MNKPYILIADDDSAILESYSAYLSEYFEVDTADTIAKAIAKLTDNKYLAAIIDMSFPHQKEGGLIIVEHIYEMKLLTRSIVLTALEGKGICNIQEAHKFGIYKYIQKSGRKTRNIILDTLLEIKKIDEI